MSPVGIFVIIMILGFSTGFCYCLCKRKTPNQLQPMLRTNPELGYYQVDSKWKKTDYHLINWNQRHLIVQHFFYENKKKW
jgi:hypothetical protein